jgi:hypothetical protein
MNETFSLILATSVLALGGLGLVFYKNSDDEDNKKGDNYDEDEIFGSNDDYIEEEEIYEVKPKVRSGKTKRNKKAGGTKRRY